MVLNSIMEDNEKLLLIAKIQAIRAQQTEVKERIRKIKERKKNLQQLSQDFQAAISDHASLEIQCLGNEQIYLSKAAIEDEKSIRQEFQDKLTKILQEKEDLEHRLEAEQEFISRNLRNRLIQLHQRTNRLRSEFSQKSHKVNQSLLELNPDDAIRIKIQSMRSQLRDSENKIAESHREIEGLLTQNQRLKLLQQNMGQNNQEKSNRRYSFAEKVPSLTLN